MRDMFGHEISVEQAREMKKRRDPTPSGYARRPGTGPAGETCGSCKNLHRNQQARVYLKCWLNREKWTGGRKTDVLAKAPACALWEAAGPGDIVRCGTSTTPKESAR